MPQGRALTKQPGRQAPPDVVPFGLEEPPAGVEYIAVLRGSSMRAASSFVIVLLGYMLISALFFQAGAWVSWQLRGRPGSLSDFYAAVMGYHYVEGVAIVDLGIALAIPICLIVYRYFGHRAPRWLASVQPGLRWRYLLLCAVIALLVLNGTYLLAQLGHTWVLAPPSNAWLWALLVLLTGPLQAAGEEYLFRGYLMQAVGGLARRSWVAIVVSAVLFAVVHGQQDAWLFVDRLGFGLLAGYLVVLTGGLEASIAIHAMNNVSSFGYAIATGTLVQARGVHQADAQIMVFDLLGYGLAAALCWLLSRRLKVATRTPDGLLAGKKPASRRAGQA